MWCYISANIWSTSACSWYRICACVHACVSACVYVCVSKDWNSSLFRLRVRVHIKRMAPRYRWSSVRVVGMDTGPGHGPKDPGC